MTATRTADPITSHLAEVKAARTAATVRERVLLLIRDHGPVTHDRLVRLHQRHHVDDDWPPATASSIRTRCSELVRDGLVERVPDALGQSDARHAATLWRARIV